VAVGYQAFVTYSTEDPSPAAAVAACARAAADEASHMLTALHGRAIPVCAVSNAQWNDLKDASDRAQAAIAVCCREAGDADQHTGWTQHVAAAVLSGHAVCDSVSRAVAICRTIDGIWVSAEQEAFKAQKGASRHVAMQYVLSLVLHHMHIIHGLVHTPQAQFGKSHLASLLFKACIHVGIL
jgi:hypothetical protein